MRDFAWAIWAVRRRSAEVAGHGRRILAVCGICIVGFFYIFRRLPKLRQDLEEIEKELVD